MEELWEKWRRLGPRIANSPTGEYIYRPIDETVLGDQQKIANSFFQLKLILKQVSVRDAVLPATR